MTMPPAYSSALAQEVEEAARRFWRKDKVQRDWDHTKPNERRTGVKRDRWGLYMDKRW